jgi:hypothetical protein
MSEEFGAGSLATLLIDHLQRGMISIEDDWYEEFDPDKVDYYKYIASPEWKWKADQAKIRAGFQCMICGNSENLEAHHRDYSHLGHEFKSDIVVLCHSCHDLFSKNKKLKQFIPY